MFLHQQDIRGLPCYKKNTVMAIRAPAGTTLEVRFIIGVVVVV